jgi:membrane fusion protein (multidrug efflux system)
MLKRLALMLLLVAAIAGGLSYTKYRQIKTLTAKFATPPPATKVAVATVEAVTWQKTISGTGSLTAVQDVLVANEVPGLVSAIHFDSGQEVAKGDPLLNLDATVDTAVLEGLVSEQGLAELQYTRALKLVRDRTMSQSDYDEAAARRNRAVSSVAAQRARIAKKTVRAPFSGTLGIRRVDLGEYLDAGASIVPLQMLDPIYLDSAIPERFLPLLAIGQEVRVHVQAYPADAFVGHITAIEPGVDPATRMVRVRAELSNPAHRLRPGMFAEVEAIQSDTERVLVVPDTAITYSPYGNSVFLVTDTRDGLTVERRQVETGTNRNGQVVVVRGVAAGDRIVAVGQNKLRNGLHVEIVDDPTLRNPPP